MTSQSSICCVLLLLLPACPPQSDNLVEPGLAGPKNEPVRGQEASRPASGSPSSWGDASAGSNIASVARGLAASDASILPGAAPAPDVVPRVLSSFAIFHFQDFAGFQQTFEQVSPSELLNLDLEDIEQVGGTIVTDALHAQGSVAICYISSGYEDWRNDAAAYPDSAKGTQICIDDACDRVWPGERWGDIRNPALHSFLGARADRAVAVGCDGIEFDNMDQAFNQTGLNISSAENVAAALQLADLAHQRGLLAMAKNAGEIAGELSSTFDGVFVEECQEHDECDIYLPFRGKWVAFVEYNAPCLLRPWAVCNEQDDYFDGDPTRGTPQNPL